MSTTSEIKAAPRKRSEFERRARYHYKVWKKILSKVFKTFFAVLLVFAVLIGGLSFIFWASPTSITVDGDTASFLFAIVRVSVVVAFVITTIKTYERENYWSHEYA